MCDVGISVCTHAKTFQLHGAIILGILLSLFVTVTCPSVIYFNHGGVYYSPFYIIIDNAIADEDRIVEDFPGTDEDSSELHTDCDPHWDDALFLLRVSQDRSLTYSGVSEMCETMQSYVEMLCSEIAQKRGLHDMSLDSDQKQLLIDECKAGDRFAELKSRYHREKFYEDKFNYVVSNFAVTICNCFWFNV